MTSVFVEKALKLAQPDLDAIVVEPLSLASRVEESGCEEIAFFFLGKDQYAAYGLVNVVPISHPIRATNYSCGKHFFYG